MNRDAVCVGHVVPSAVVVPTLKEHAGVREVDADPRPELPSIGTQPAALKASPSGVAEQERIGGDDEASPATERKVRVEAGVSEVAERPAVLSLTTEHDLTGLDIAAGLNASDVAADVRHIAPADADTAA